MLSFRDMSNLDAKELTRLKIFELIRERGQIARKDIADLTGYSPATVTSITADIIGAGLLQEKPVEALPGSGQRGRPKVLLKMRGQHVHVAGVKIARQFISVLITDLEGNELACCALPLAKARMSPEEMMAEVKRIIKAGCDEAGLLVHDLAGIGLAMAGLIDAPRNFVHWSSSLDERHVDFAPLIRAHLPCPMFIENDANLVAKAEQLFGEGRGHDHFLVITIEHGVGLGIILNGELYRGVGGFGAEFGHTKVQLDGALCQCGQRGCLEAYVGDYALMREATVLDPVASPTSLTEIFERAHNGDPAAGSILYRAGQMFAMGMANLINLFSPELIILAGAQIRFDHLHSEKVMDQIRAMITQQDDPLPEIRVHHWGDRMWTRGAAAHAIEQVSYLKIKEMTANAAG